MPERHGGTVLEFRARIPRLKLRGENARRIDNRQGAAGSPNDISSERCVDLGVCGERLAQR